MNCHDKEFNTGKNYGINSGAKFVNSQLSAGTNKGAVTPVGKRGSKPVGKR